MIISKVQIQSLLKVYGTSKTESPKETAKTKKAAPTDSMSISDTAKAFHQARQILKDIPEVREELVAELQQAVKTGTYEVKEEDIAEKMIARTLVDELV